MKKGVRKMKVKDKINTKVKLIIIITIIITTIISIGIAYAKYVTTLIGNSQVQISKWNFKITEKSSESLSIDLAKTRFENDNTEVDKTKVAPGTKGALEFNIDASDSQVSLEYDINMNLTKIPENLMFYTNEEMTNALYKDNGQIRLGGYFRSK